MSKMEKSEQLVELVVLAFQKEALKRLVFSRPKGSEIKKISGRLVSHKRGKMLALEYQLPGDTVKHKNLSEQEIVAELYSLIEEYCQVNLITALGDAEWKVSKGGKVALLGGEKLRARLTAEAPSFESAIEALDRKKDYILSGGEDFLKALGISDASGRVKDKRQGKFRQINRFLQHISDIYEELPSEGEILIYDLCCGKSYLSFAVYYYLTALRKRSVRLLGMDLKRDVIIWCQELATRLDYKGMRFVYDDVKNTPDGERPDMVISLHACDLATDIVINRAIALGAKVVLSTPCCHRYINDKIKAESLGFITRFPHLRNKLGEALTDALRLMRLEAAGYKVAALELTDPDDTPKNTLIRAIHRTEGKDNTEYERALSFVLGEGAADYLKEI